MLRASPSLIEGFQRTIQESTKNYGEKLEEIRELIFTCNEFKSITETGDENSLVFWCFMESFRLSGHSLYLSYCGLYRNAYDNIRHVLESIVQAYYVDSNHPSADLPTKLEILSEIEDKREYHASQLIEQKISFKSLDNGGLDCKGLLKKQYAELSRRVHPSHENVIGTVKDVQKGLEENWMPAKIDGLEIERIFELMKPTFDILFFLVIASNPALKTTLSENTKLAENIQKYNLKLLEAILKS
jgi:hypothetical protein